MCYSYTRGKFDFMHIIKADGQKIDTSCSFIQKIIIIIIILGLKHFLKLFLNNYWTKNFQVKPK